MLYEKRTIILLSIACLLIGSISTSMIVVKSESTTVTLIDESFENGFPPSDWVNTGWLDSHYGDAHFGTHWAYSWAEGDALTLPMITLGTDSELRFWTRIEMAGHPMSINVTCNGDVIFSDIDYNQTEYEEQIVDLSSYDNETIVIVFYGEKSDFFGQMIDDIFITTIKESSSPPTPPHDNGSPPTPPPAENQAPIANCEAQEPYQCVIGDTIIFDASLSIDVDGAIVYWLWDFGDNSTGEGETIIHEYLMSGEYNVVCTVTDDKNLKDSCETIAAVFQQKNIPPIQPIMDGPEAIGVNEYAIFYVSSTDGDNDMISYYFDWGDNTSNFTIYYGSNETINISNSWDTAGIYDVIVYSKDEFYARSAKTHKIILVDVNIYQINDEITGYLIDYHRTNTYTVFYNNDTGIETMVEQDTNDGYLIDEDGDGQWDYVYNMKNGLQVYSGDITQDESESPGFEIIFVVLAILMQFLFLKKRKIQ